MKHKLSVTVQIDPNPSHVRLVVGGCLTEDSFHELLPLLRRADALFPSSLMTADLADTSHIDPSGLTLLRSAVDRMEEGGLLAPVEFRVPDRLPPGAPDHAREAVMPR